MSPAANSAGLSALRVMMGDQDMTDENAQIRVIMSLQRELASLHQVRQEEAEQLVKRMQELDANEFHLINFVESSRSEMRNSLDLLQKAKGTELLLRKRLDSVMIEHEFEMSALRQAYDSLREAAAHPGRVELDLVRTKVARLQASMAETAKAAGHAVSWSPPAAEDVEMETEFAEMEACLRALTASTAKRDDEAAALRAQLDAALAAAQQAQQAEASLQTSLVAVKEERRQLHNQVMDLKGAVRVFCRCRPLIQLEVDAGWAPATHCDEFLNTIDVFAGRVGGRMMAESSEQEARQNRFEFDKVFGPQADQRAVYHELQPIITSVTDGYNACIFAYGQTRSGKTHTMQGSAEMPGVAVRALEDLISRARSAEAGLQVSLSLSMLEVYNDSVFDLLTPTGEDRLGRASLAIGEGLAGNAKMASKVLESAAGTHSSKVAQGGGARRAVRGGIKGAYVVGLEERRVESLEDALAVLAEGDERRSIAETASNRESSRSHGLVCVHVHVERASGSSSVSKLWLIDLAGSERLHKSHATGDRLREAQYINRSLSALADCISALCNRAQHVPYRDTKLTHLLQESLSGGSKVLMLVAVNPTEHDASETLCSLQFASRVRGLELGSAARNASSSAELRNAHAQLANLQASRSALQMENDGLRQQVLQLQATREQEERDLERAKLTDVGSAAAQLSDELRRLHAELEAAQAVAKHETLRAKALEGDLTQALEALRGTAHRAGPPQRSATLRSEEARRSPPTRAELIGDKGFFQEVAGGERRDEAARCRTAPAMPASTSRTPLADVANAHPRCPSTAYAARSDMRAALASSRASQPPLGARRWLTDDSASPCDDDAGDATPPHVFGRRLAVAESAATASVHSPDPCRADACLVRASHDGGVAPTITSVATIDQLAAADRARPLGVEGMDDVCAASGSLSRSGAAAAPHARTMARWVTADSTRAAHHPPGPPKGKATIPTRRVPGSDAEPHVAKLMRSLTQMGAESGRDKLSVSLRSSGSAKTSPDHAIEASGPRETGRQSGLVRSLADALAARSPEGVASDASRRNSGGFVPTRTMTSKAAAHDDYARRFSEFQKKRAMFLPGGSAAVVEDVARSSSQSASRSRSRPARVPKTPRTEGCPPRAPKTPGGEGAAMRGTATTLGAGPSKENVRPAWGARTHTRGA